MDTFTPPFEPQTPPAPSPLPAQPVPTPAPLPVEVPPSPAPTPIEITTPITPKTSTNTAQAPNNTWQILLIAGLVLFLAGTAGYLFLWLR